MQSGYRQFHRRVLLGHRPAADSADALRFGRVRRSPYADYGATGSRVNAVKLTGNGLSGKVNFGLTPTKSRSVTLPGAPERTAWFVERSREAIDRNRQQANRRLKAASITRG